MLGDWRSAVGFYVRSLGWGFIAGLIFTALLVACSDKLPASHGTCKITSIESGICASSRRPGVIIHFADGHSEVFCAPAKSSQGY